MFHNRLMQLSLGFAAPSILPALRDRLRAVFGQVQAEPRLDPLSQMIKSLVSARTYDETSWAAFVRLRAAFPDWNDLATAQPRDIEAIIEPVTFADRKARQLPVLIRVLQLRRRNLDLNLLADMPIEEAMTWLQGLPGIGCKSAAAVLNFSTLNRRALVVDTHLHRVARRLGLVGRATLPSEAYAILMAEAPTNWTAEDLLEFHWLLKKLGQSVCTDAQPSCALCPMRGDCARVDVSADGPVQLVFRARPVEDDLGG
jgi:endonuclease-3